MKHICVFCGSSPGLKKEYMEAASILGTTLAERKITLVYGGASVGLMGQAARSCLEKGGEVIGVITRNFVEQEVAFTKLTNLYVVETMHERKAKMAELSDGFIALPGGLGTLEELFEILTWSQLGIHTKPCGLLNTCGYYDDMIRFLDLTVDQQFVEPVHRQMIQIDDQPDKLLDKFEVYQPPQANKADWVRQLTEQANAKQ
ncbi:TIGR00730 family Rossman fold protein [Leptolinea tardivitalis]|uniref:Cytokinin riboside 5'-monophosphate phosphoribohydrolase n=1 Tax=Leptolinea tardivitalis TaxID=229920 RepID=A0A0P6XF25_9CHLR|nr:TIGR00730 family Rossman fold protein [Leptolinea tardivitalis]KPL73417.1 LOG family protein [Leptolinea tardivitalis]GAP21576.1 TIGR00730 family protein [Leptolinea tardivitalis]